MRKLWEGIQPLLFRAELALRQFAFQLWVYWRKRRLAGADLSLLSFQGLDLRRANLRQANLTRADLSRADLRQAEEAMVTIESGLRGVHTRADAVSSLAEARIAVELASQSVAWRPAEVQEAHAKLEEAERQLEAGRAGSAFFFASRARRIAERLSEEADQVARHTSTRFVHARQLNLRAGPSTDARVIGVLAEKTPVFEIPIGEAKDSQDPAEVDRRR